LPWTEYQLYDTFLVRTGRFDQYHVALDDYVICGNSVWSSDDFATWDPRVPDPWGRHFAFSVIQSFAGLRVDQVARRLRDLGTLD
jgi:hypothetical protein